MMSVSFAAAQNPSSKAPAQPLVQITPVSQSEVVFTVVDQLGAVIANASVRMVHRTTEQESHGKTDKNGVYKFTGLAPGPYEISVASPGFATYKAQIALKDSDVLRQEITLAIDAQAMEMGVIVEVPESVEPLPANINLTPKLRRAK